MPMPLPANAVKIGDHAYLFPSPAKGRVTDCFIAGHGGTPHGNPRHFEVPGGCTVNFFTDFLRANKMDEGPIGGFKVIAGENAGAPPEIKAVNRFTGGTQRSRTRDYILAKAVGSHYEHQPGKDDYMEISKLLAEMADKTHAPLQWLPHYVSIRNRTSWFCSTNVWLSRVIEDIRKHDSGIVNFYCANCRITISGKTEEKYVKSAGSQGFG